MISCNQQRENRNTQRVQNGFDNLVILSRADPIICGHSTETRNLAEAAIQSGVQHVDIVSYPLDILESSDLPLKPMTSVESYSQGITVWRPTPVGDYKVLDGRLGYAISGQIIDLLARRPGKTAIMNLYLVPHGQMVLQAVHAIRGFHGTMPLITIAEAVGSDITNVVSNALATRQFGAAALVLQNYLEHDLPVAVSAFTRDLIVDAGKQIDAVMGTTFAFQLQERVQISYPALDTSAYLSPAINEVEQARLLSRRGLVRDGYILFLSRLTNAKGVDDLIKAFQRSDFYGRLPLVICGTGPDEHAFQQLAAHDSAIHFFNDVGDLDKLALMAGCHAYCLPSKPRKEFTETFGIAVVEAMLSAGIGPVITTRTGGIPEATGDHCIYHHAGDVNHLTACLNEVAKMPDHARAMLSQRARDYACRFDRQSILANLLNTSTAKTTV